MFHVNDTVMYGGCGVCRVDDIRPEKFGQRELLYYVLKPVDQKGSTFYCPVESGGEKLRRLLSREELFGLLHSTRNAAVEWIANDQQRRESFTRILKDGDQSQLLRLLRALYLHRQERLRSGRKFFAADERIMKEAEHLLYGEIAQVMRIDPDQVTPFLQGELGEED